jgi:hypothetical protein
MRQRRMAERGRYSPSTAIKRRSRRETDRRRQRMLYIGAAVVTMIIVLLLASGFYVTAFRPPHKIVAHVGEVPVKLSQTLALNRIHNGMIGVIDSGRALDLVISNEILRQRAGPEFGVSVLASELEVELVGQFESPTGPGTELPQVFTAAGRQRYQALLDILNVSDEDYRSFMEGGLLLDLVNGEITAQVPSPQEQVFLYWIVVASNQGGAVLERLQAGEEFAVVAQEANIETAFANENGQVGWVPRGIFEPLDELIFSAAEDELIGPLETPFGSVIAKVVRGPEELGLTIEMRSVLGDIETGVWLRAQTEELLNGYALNNNDAVWVIDRLN